MRKANYFTEKELELFNAHKPLFDESQMKIINRKTPASEIEVKTDRNGFKYKTVNYDMRFYRSWSCHWDYWTPTWHKDRGPYISIGLGYIGLYRGY